jgi:hypothetical protein
MKTTIQSILVAAALVTASASVMAAAEGVAANNGATSVVEMMQRKQEHQLRARLVAEGRWDQVRQLDDDHAKRTGEEQETRYKKVNEGLGRSANVEGPDQSPLLNECDPGKLPR